MPIIVEGGARVPRAKKEKKRARMIIGNECRYCKMSWASLHAFILYSDTAHPHPSYNL